MRQALTEERRDLVVRMAKDTLYDDSSESSEAREYIFGKRKISKQVAAAFRIGYVPKMAFSTGVPGRLILPLYDHHDRLVSITTRDWRDGAHNRGHWHESFEKKWYLYGLNQALPAIVASRRVVLVEGQFDVLRLHSIGVDNAVGLLGSKPGWYQVALLLREADEVMLAFDNDDAGRVGVSEVFKILKQSGMSKMPNVKMTVVRLGPAKDADELVDRLGPEAVQERFR
jgi:DNA primase